MKELADRIEAAIKPSSMCRDCADFGPRCPNDGELCDSKDRAKELSDMVRSSVEVSKLQEALKLVEDENIHIGERYYVLNKVIQKLIDEAKQ